MRGSVVVAKGRIEEAAGTLVNNDKLRTKGKRDQAAGHVRQATEAGVRHARESAHNIVEKAKGAAQKVVDKARKK
jgi:uncharacterized protein YjbJ (UPF0337 family)